jgi:cytochrome c peroxidase
MAKDQLGENLPAQDVKAIVAFLETLNGDQPKVVYPALPPRSRDTPLPQ